MEDTTRYRNTDLDLTSSQDLTELAGALEKLGLALMRPVMQIANEKWFCGFSWGGEWFEEPEQCIRALLSAVEALDSTQRSAWAGCTLRMFDIGYDCGKEPFAFRQELSPATLVRLAEVGATLRWTLYSDPLAGEFEPAEE